MSVATYAELKALIEDRLDRTVTQFPAMVALSEDYIHSGEDYKLRTKDMEATRTLSLSSGVYTLSDDVLELISVKATEPTIRTLEYMDQAKANEFYPNREGCPEHYMRVGNAVTALPSASGDIEIFYYMKIPALTEADATNWLILKYPNIYYRAVLAQCCEFYSKPEEMAYNKALADKAIIAANGSDQVANWRGVSVMQSEECP